MPHPKNNMKRCDICGKPIHPVLNKSGLCGLHQRRQRYTEAEKKEIYETFQEVENKFYEKLRKKMLELSKDEKLKKEMFDDIHKKLSGVKDEQKLSKGCSKREKDSK